MSTIPAIGVALALVVSVSVVPPQAQDREITYDKLMQQNVAARLASFNRLNPEQKSSILRTHIQRWIEANRATLTPEQLAVTDEWKEFANVANFAESLTEERHREIKDIETRSAEVFSRGQLRDALTLQGPYIPPPQKLDL